MSPPTLVSQTETSATVTWTALTTPNDGDSSIILYDLYWDNGSGTTTIPLSSALLYSYTVSGLSSASTYLFKVRAKNIYGYSSLYSTTLSVIPSDIPSPMAIATVSLVGTDVKILWTAPNDHNDAIDKYEVLLLKADGTTFIEDLTNCDGSDLTISGQLYCLIPMVPDMIT